MWRRREYGQSPHLLFQFFKHKTALKSLLIKGVWYRCQAGSLISKEIPLLVSHEPYHIMHGNILSLFLDTFLDIHLFWEFVSLWLAFIKMKMCCFKCHWGQYFLSCMKICTILVNSKQSNTPLLSFSMKRKKYWLRLCFYFILTGESTNWKILFKS